MLPATPRHQRIPSDDFEIMMCTSGSEHVDILILFYISLEVLPLSVMIAWAFLAIFPPAWLFTWFLETVFLSLVTFVALFILLPVVPVYVGRKQLAPPLAYHWAARIGPSMWFEVNGASKEETGESNSINEKLGGKSELGVEEAIWVGYATVMRTLQYKHFCQSYDLRSSSQRSIPRMTYIPRTCQHFVRSFIHNLCGESVAKQLPLDDHEKYLHALASVAPSIGHVFREQWKRGFKSFPSSASSNKSQDRSESATPASTFGLRTNA